jgi:hypothetical protein
MKPYQDHQDNSSDAAKATPKPKRENPRNWMPQWEPAKFSRDDYAQGADGRIIRRHLPLNRRPSRRALKRNVAAILAK